MTRSDGTPVNAVYGFASMLMKLLQDTQSEHIAVIFDAKRSNFRNEIYAQYKVNRGETPEELIPQFSLINDTLDAMQVAHIRQEGFEADDLIATYAKAAIDDGMDVTIVSSDKDLMQLVRPGVKLWDPMKNRDIGLQQVQEKFGVAPNRVIDVQALAGDSSDNIPGVPGIGVKTAATLIGEFGDLDSLLAGAHTIKQPKRRESLITFAQQARMSRQLVTLREDAPLPVPIKEFQRRAYDTRTLAEFFRMMGFKSLVQRLGATVQDVQEPSDNMIDHDAYETITTPADLQHWVEGLHREHIIAIGTETTSQDFMQAELVGIALCVGPKRACYIPLTHKTHPQDLMTDVRPEEVAQIPIEEALEILRPLLLNPAVLKIGHNIKYGMAVLAKYDLSLTPIDDVMVMSFCLSAGQHAHGLDELADHALSHTAIALSALTGSGKSAVSFDYVPIDKATVYAAERCDIILRLYHIFKPQLVKDKVSRVYELIERPLISILWAMEAKGIRVDQALLHDLSADFGKRMQDLQARCYDLAAEEFNLGSPKQLGEILFGKMGLKGGKKTKTGQYSTNQDVLENLAQDHEIVDCLLQWRQLAKLRNTYTEALQTFIQPTTTRIHTCYSMIGAQTGRLSSNDPNLQNIPIRTNDGRKIRRAFIAKPDHVLVSMDYSQIELRVMAEMADIASLQEAFANNLDIHAATASQVFHLPLDQIDSELRRRAKAINFGIIYGISAFGLGNQIHCSTSEAKEIIARYFSQFPGIRGFMEST
ncbi:MAG: DNA polymerase I, partial [Pseudomonadota bacterium]